MLSRGLSEFVHLAKFSRLRAGRGYHPDAVAELMDRLTTMIDEGTEPSLVAEAASSAELPLAFFGGVPREQVDNFLDEVVLQARWEAGPTDFRPPHQRHVV